MVMWPKTILPSAVAGPVAAKALQRIGLGGGFGLRRFQREADALQAGRRRVEGASRGSSISGQALRATTSIRSMGRPSKLAPAALAPSAMPFISSRYSLS